MSHSIGITKFIISSSLFLMLFVATKVHAHLHMFIDNTTSCIFDDNGFKGFWTGWVFYDMFKAFKQDKILLNSIRARNQSPTPDIFQNCPSS